MRKNMIGQVVKMLQNIKKDTDKGLYTIVAPATICSDCAYDVTITLHDEFKPATIKVSISGPGFLKSQTIDISPSSTDVVHFDIPPLEKGYYELEVEGIKGLIFKKRETLDLIYKLPRIYIQLDKSLYKPEDWVQYRILALDEYLKPAKIEQPLTVVVEDGASNKIKKIKDLKLTTGVYTGKFQLSEQPVLGQWEIKVLLGEDEKVMAFKNFGVDKYVLPKFSVELEADKKLALLDKKFKVNVRSKYTYGKPVTGKAKIKASFHSPQTLLNRINGAEKTIDIEGKGQVEFDIFEDLKMDLYQGYNLPTIYVEAVMTEAFTGLEQNTNNLTTISVESSRYKITVPNMSKTYEINQPFEITAIITKLNGSPVTNARSTAKLMMSQYELHRLKTETVEMNQLIYESAVDKNGVAVFKLKFTSEVLYQSVQILYEETIQMIPEIKVLEKLVEHTKETEANDQLQHSGPFQIFPKNKDVDMDEEIVIDVKNKDPIPYFVYTVLVRGKIVLHEYVKIEDNKNCATIKIKPTVDLYPCAKFFAYFIKDGKLVYDETRINVRYRLKNKLEITSVEQAKPSDTVTLNIKTEPNSYVGLLGVDQSVLLLQTGNDLDEEEILRGLECYNIEAERNLNPGSNSGFLTITNAAKPTFSMRFGHSTHRALMLCEESSCRLLAYTDCIEAEWACCRIEPQIRKNFIDSWIFDNIQSTDDQGMASLTKKIPDTITSWVITGFSLNDQIGLGMTQKPTNIKVFQPFFLSTNLPYSIKRGEIIAIPIMVFNYTESDLDAVITMENSDDEYDFTEEIKEATDNNKQRTKNITISANSGETLSITICPKIIGEITLKIKAITPMAGDVVHQKLRVECEGITQYRNEAFFFSVNSGESLKHTFQPNIPVDSVLNSEYLELSAMGDILAPTIQNIDQLVRMPYGCGEQNMVNFVPNILVLHYLEIIKAEMPSVIEKAKNYMEKGYQRELTYKHKNGAYSAFGENCSEANSWLTAYVVRSFIQARQYIEISENIIEQALDYLVSIQKTDGQFPMTGSLFYSTNQSKMGISAFIMLALLEDEIYAMKFKNQIEKGLQYLVSNIESAEDIYTMALVTLVLQKAQHLSAANLVEKIELQANNENNLKWWSADSNSSSNNNIEITAYILQILLTSEEEAGNLLPIIKWLIGRRNSLGGFDSTQDTVVGLQALIKFAEKYAAGSKGKITITYEAQAMEAAESTKGTIEVDTDNAMLLQSHVLPKSTRHLTVSASGQGSSLVQLSYRYNMLVENNEPSFHIQHTFKPCKYSGQLQQNISAEFKPLNSEEAPVNQKSNMAVMEICLPSGYTTNDDSLKSICDNTQIQRVETKNDNTVIIVYFESLTAGQPVSFDVMGERTHEIENLKPAPITIYDYYNTAQRATLYYELIFGKPKIVI